MIQEHTIGRITDITEEGLAVIHAALPNLKHALDRKYDEVEIILPDGRRISPDQRRKCFAIIKEISDFVNGQHEAADIEETKEIMKWDFMLSRFESQERKLFSLSNVDVTTARNFIDYLIEFCVKNDVPMQISPLEYCEDVSKYLYACMVNKKCCVCGKPADLHHVDAIGMGNDRTEVIHIGREALPLCREHHTLLHSMGNKKFMETYHLQAVEIDKKIAKVYGLNAKEK
jgi:hypothetical protein